eukprot:5998331-Ditylum_brightwellii.AAC.1
MNPNGIVVVDFGYGTGKRLKATILLERSDSDGVFYCFKGVDHLEGIEEWEAVVPRGNVRRQNVNTMIYTPRRIHSNNSDIKDGDDDE